MLLDQLVWDAGALRRICKVHSVNYIPWPASFMRKLHQLARREAAVVSKLMNNDIEFGGGYVVVRDRHLFARRIVEIKRWRRYRRVLVDFERIEHGPDHRSELPRFE